MFTTRATFISAVCFTFLVLVAAVFVPKDQKGIDLPDDVNPSETCSTTPERVHEEIFNTLMVASGDLIMCDAGASGPFLAGNSATKLGTNLGKVGTESWSHAIQRLAETEYKVYPRERADLLAKCAVQAGVAHNVEPGVLLGIAWHESRFQFRAVGDHGVSHGLTQVRTDFPGRPTPEELYNPCFALNYTAKKLSNWRATTGSGKPTQFVQAWRWAGAGERAMAAEIRVRRTQLQLETEVLLHAFVPSSLHANLTRIPESLSGDTAYVSSLRD